MRSERKEDELNIQLYYRSGHISIPAYFMLSASATGIVQTKYRGPGTRSN